jgi:hypothetical protein
VNVGSGGYVTLMGVMTWFRERRERKRLVEAHEHELAEDVYGGDPVEVLEEPLGTPGKGQAGGPPSPGLGGISPGN